MSTLTNYGSQPDEPTVGKKKRISRLRFKRRNTGDDPVTWPWIVSNTDVDPVNGCFNWVGSTDTYGYGLVNIDGINEKVHRVSYLINKGPISEAECVCHTCDNPKCCNPGHLFLGSKLVNATDMVNKGRQARGRKQARAVLDDAAILDIRSTPKYWGVLRRLGEKYGVTPTCIWCVRNGATWKHV